MTRHAEGMFRVTSWTEETYEAFDGGTRLARARISLVLGGDLEATGAGEALLCYRADGTAVFVGLERLVGRIGDRSGSFVLRIDGDYDGHQGKNTWSVVPGTGTDALRSLRGAGGSVAAPGTAGRFTLDYDLD